MLLSILGYVVLGVATFPFFYYLIALYSSWRFFKRPTQGNPNFTPPVSVLKPVKGLDPNAYQNFASFCTQDYPKYEVVFCVDQNDPAVAVLEKLKSDFPQCEMPAAVRIGPQFYQ